MNQGYDWGGFGCISLNVERILRLKWDISLGYETLEIDYVQGEIVV